MRRIASLRGKLYELRELSPEESVAIAIANGYESQERFIYRHENWQSTITEQLRVHDSFPVRPPRFKTKPITITIGEKKRGRPAKPKTISTTKMSPTSKKRRKRRSKYGFEKIRTKGDSIFVEGETYRIAAAAAYFGSKYDPPRRYSVHKAKLGDISGARIEWVNTPEGPAAR